MSEVSSAAQTGEVAQANTTRGYALLYAATLFLSAFLLFQVQLILSKYILPWFGGSAAVWTTSMLVFQVLLLGGYVYSHLVTDRLAPKLQGTLHLAVLAAALLLVMALWVLWPSPVTPGIAWRPPTGQSPIREVVAILLLAAGAPFFVLSTTGPLLQRWFAQRGGDARTYRLYAVSNVGSLLGVLTFPFVFEPLLRTTVLGRIWAGLFCMYVIACGWAAWQIRSQPDFRPVAEAADTGSDAAVTPNALVRTLWFLLAACGSAMLLATTNLLCQELTSVPLLWVLPLALYLLSFILCFDHPRWYRREVFHPLFAIGVFAEWAASQYKLQLAQVVTMPILLFVACMICHGELVRLKPEVRKLTSFYLAVASGGALGGVFVALVAPQIFRSFAEYQVTLATTAILLLVCLVFDKKSWYSEIGLETSAAIAAGVTLLAIAGGAWVPGLMETLIDARFYPLWLLLATLVVAGAYIQRRAPEATQKFRAGQVLVIVVTLMIVFLEYQDTRSDPRFYLRTRNF